MPCMAKIRMLLVGGVVICRRACTVPYLYPPLIHRLGSSQRGSREPAHDHTRTYNSAFEEDHQRHSTPPLAPSVYATVRPTAKGGLYGCWSRHARLYCGISDAGRLVNIQIFHRLGFPRRMFRARLYRDAHIFDTPGSRSPPPPRGKV